MEKSNNTSNINQPSLAEYVCSTEPLSEDKLDFILNYKGESLYLDFKVSFNTGETREWLEITKDITAFANTNGGYLVFGIKDRTFDKIGILENDCHFLIDPDNIQKKVNAYISPPITSLTTREKIINGSNFMVIHIPESIGKTHIVAKEGKFKNKDGNEIITLRKGNIYIKRSGASILIEPNDLDTIIEKRINYYKGTLFKNIAKLVEAPAESEVLIFDPNVEEISTGGRKFVLSNDSDAIPIKGMSTTVIPQTDENEIATIIAAFRKDKGHLPAKGLLYRIYAKRDQIGLSKGYFKDIVLISIDREVPCFYWLQFLFKKEVEEILDKAFEGNNFFVKSTVLKIAACFGKSYFSKYFKKDNDPRHKWMERKYKQSGCDVLFFKYEIGKTIEQMEKEATELALTLSQAKSLNAKTKATDNDKLWSIDYELYAQHITKKAET